MGEHVAVRGAITRTAHCSCFVWWKCLKAKNDLDLEKKYIKQMADLPVKAGTISYPDSLGSLASGWSSGETLDTRLSRVKCNPPKGLWCFYKLTLDLWLNFDSSICIITPGPPNCGIGWHSSAPHATSRHFLANLTRTFVDAVPSIAITFKESFCAHFQRNCNSLPKEILLPAKYEFTLTDEARRQRKHFLLSSPKWSF